MKELRQLEDIDLELGFDPLGEAPPERQRLREATPEDRAALAAEPYETRTVDFDAEEAFTVGGEFSWDKVLVDCPRCGKGTAPFRRRELPAFVSGGWEWVGLDYQQPFADYICVCSSCRKPFVLHTYTPQ